MGGRRRSGEPPKVPEVGTGPVSFEDSVSPQFFELERDAIFRRAWLNVGRVDDLSHPGSWFTKDLVAARTSVLVVRDVDGEIRAFHNVCRHRGNKILWDHSPRETASGMCRQFVCKYHGWRYRLDGDLTFVLDIQNMATVDRILADPGTRAGMARLSVLTVRIGGFPAARVGDTTMHGVPIAPGPGELTVISGG